MPGAAGLTGTEAAARLRQHGPNAVPEARPHPWRVLLGKFWSPVPWMLEATVVLQLALGKSDEALVIAILLVFNALLSFFQENRANRALALLRQRLSVTARVLRDGRWQTITAQELVPGDVVHVRLGDLAPADIRLTEGALLLDQSTLTGESLPVEAGAGATAYAGSTVRRGEATGEVTGTGSHTYFGRTAELVRLAKTESHLTQLILRIVRYLVTLDGVLVVALFLYAIATGLALHDLLPFALILLVASVPVALPATFTVAQAFGAQALARRGVLVTRLSAIEEAAAMDVLASDKTGTLTKNRLTVAALRPFAPHDETQLLRLAALACDEATQDPIDLTILAAARSRDVLANLPERVKFIPFDPETKRTEAVYRDNGELRVIKGAARTVAALVPGAPDLNRDMEQLAAGGYRVLAVAAGVETLRFVGLLALEDPPRADSGALVQSLKAFGVRVVMVTGDALATARAVAARLGLGERACAAEALRQGEGDPTRDCDVFARVLPEDKFHLVKNLQRAGHVTGMTGDGVNDAPALKQAEVGIAVANATDVAKAAASLVLTNPGLADIMAAIDESRRIYRRMLTYTLNKIIKTIEIALFLSVGVMLTGVFVVTPLLIVLLLFTNDFVTMAIATDHAEPASRPVRWDVRRLVLVAAVLAVLVLALSFTVFFTGRDVLCLPLPQLQTLIFLMLVFTGQGNVYLVRTSRHLWQSRPSRWLLLASILDVVAVSVLAIQGIFMEALSPALVAGLLATVLLYLALLDFIKVRLFRRLDLR
ncbi:MAG TPA: plasma-membrane proton-efflux P-type ATPase [Candidatus Methylomirabilis sp.]|nr:plasma-membrane proton-efflux P-type ATPase [Candidatus Methylomirabilis sp.]